MVAKSVSFPVISPVAFSPVMGDEAILARDFLNGLYLWGEVSGELTPTDLISGASAGQGFTIVDSDTITPTTAAISDDPNWELNGDSDLTPTT